MGTLAPSYATDPFEEERSTFKRKADNFSPGETPLKKRKFKEDWFDLLSEKYLSPSDYEEYDVEMNDLDPAPGVIQPVDDQALEALADLYRYFPQDLFNYILFKALDDQEEAPLSLDRYRRLMSWTMVSKDYYQRITGYPFTLKLTHWENNREYSNTLINHYGLATDIRLSHEIDNLYGAIKSIQDKWYNRRFDYQQKLGISETINNSSFLQEQEKEIYPLNQKIKNIKNIKKHIVDSSAKYYLEGTKIQLLPRYAVEATTQLSIPFKKLFIKSFTSKGKNRFLDLAKRLEGTGITEVKIDVDYKGYDRALLAETSLGIIQLMTHLPAQVSKMDLSQVLLTPPMMEAFAAQASKCPLKKIGLSSNPHHLIEKGTWERFAKGLQTSKVEEIDLFDFIHRDNYQNCASSTKNPGHEPDSRVLTRWVRDFFAEFSQENDQDQKVSPNVTSPLKRVSISHLLHWFSIDKMEGFLKNLSLKTLDLTRSDLIVYRFIFNFHYEVIEELLSAPHIQEIYFSPINQVWDVTTQPMLDATLKKLEENRHKIDTVNPHTLHFPYDANFAHEPEHTNVWSRFRAQEREDFLKGLRAILPNNFVIKTLEGVYNPSV